MHRFVVLALLIVSCQTHRGIAPDDRDGGEEDASAPDADDGSMSLPDAGDEPDAGVDAGPATPCYGRAPSCFGRDYAACEIGLGCNHRPICLGTAFPCIHIVDSPSCVAQIGCSWSGTACTGAQTPCSQLDPATTCSQQFGCASTFACEGQIEACADIPDESTCLSQAGCSWDGSVAPSGP